MSKTSGAPDLPGLKYLEPLGTGGFSEVYLYERDQPRIKVAVKLMKADVLDDAQRRQFVIEADTMAELAEHPFIVPVLGAGTAPDGRPYLEMRYYPPPDLGERVAAEPMSVPDALRTGIQLASAIETAHRSGIIHRDIKPSNILVSSYGVPGLSDFGIAGRALDTQEDDDHLGVSMPWSPPEILTGASNGSASSDVYSLGATIWNLLVGRSPFTIKGGDNTERAMFTRILHSRPPATGRAEVPGSLDRLLQQSMSKEPGHRPQSAMEFARHLQRVEQELRLARTEIVVLESRTEHPPAAPTPAPATPAPAARQQPDGPSPWAAPADPAPEAAPPTQRRPRTVSPSVPNNGASSNATADNATQVRPRVVPAASETVRPPTRVSPGRHSTTAAGAPSDQGSTVRRPTTVPAGELPAEDEPGTRSNRTLAFVAAGVLLVAVIAVGALLGSGEDKREPDADLPNGSGPTAANGAVGGSGQDPVPASPDVKAATSGKNVVFTWKPEKAGDRYVYTFNGRQAAAPTPRVSLPRNAGKKVCIRVTAIRGAAQSADNPLICGGP